MNKDEIRGAMKLFLILLIFLIFALATDGVRIGFIQ